jgi:ligand-binding sensor domain-containing protein
MWTRWHEGRFTTFTLQDGLPSYSITALAEDNTGRIWVGTESGLVVWDNGRLTPLTAAEGFKGKRITALFQDHKGAMWLGAANTGEFYFQGGRFAPLQDASAAAKHSQNLVPFAVLCCMDTV